jgi:iron complex outermembrane receptor protein
MKAEKKRIFFLVNLLLPAIYVHAQPASDTSANLLKPFRLGEVFITETIDRETVSSPEMHKHNANDLSTSFNSLPSVILNNSGARNERTIFLRGFDIRSVPVFMDGIPVYVPYDGYMDLSRFTTYDISKIDVSKGFSSMMYGANTIGGAINLVGMKPSHKFEISAKSGVMSGNGYDAKLNIGSNLGKVYFQTGFSLLNQEFIRLSAKSDTSEFETDHRRDHSSRKDIKGSIKIGFTPNNTDEYSINYIYSHGSKGNPVYLGKDNTIKIRYWDWPYWNKQCIYIISKKAFSPGTYLKARMYYDEFKNMLSSFDDNSYSSQQKGYSFNSYFRDYTLGGNLEFSSDLGKSNILKLSAHLKNDNHGEHNEREPTRHMVDNTYSFSVEDIYKPTLKLVLIPGIGYHIRKSVKAEIFNSTDRTIVELPDNASDAFNMQLAAYYKFSGSLNTNFNVSYKTRFATLKDRYSYRLGTSLPNTDLKSEAALNFELSFTISMAENLNVRPEFFYSYLFNTIQLVSNVQEDISQMQNTGSSEFSGADLSLIYQPIENVRLQVVYSQIKRKNLSNPEILFTDVPKNKIFATAAFTFAKKLFVSVTGEYHAKRNSSSDGTRISPAFAIANGELSYHFSKYLYADFGISNLFDKNYTLEEGYPEMGRNIYGALHFNLQK